MDSFTIDWVAGTDVSVTFSSRPETSYVIPNCPVADVNALVERIREWWTWFNTVYPTPEKINSAVSDEVLNSIGQSFTTHDSGPVVQ